MDRLKLAVERPSFRAHERRRHASKAPRREAFTCWRNLRLVLIALFGAVAGQGVVWYTGQFYALFYLERIAPRRRRRRRTSLIVALRRHAVLHLLRLAVDRIGRSRSSWRAADRRLTYFPLFRALGQSTPRS